MTKQFDLIGVKILFLFACLLFISGCTPEKAKSIRLAAEQFSNQALIAVNAVDKAMKDEISPKSRSAQEQTDQFVEFLSKLDLAELTQENVEVGFPTLQQAANPDAITLDPDVLKARTLYLSGLRTRYSTFSGMLHGLEEGSFFAADAIGRANKIAGRLTSDMASIAKHFTTHPPQLIQQRGSIAADTLNILENNTLSQTSKKDRLALIKTRFDDIKIAEQQLLRSVLEPSLKAAELGYKLQKMAAGYNQLTVSDMQNLLLRSIRIVGNLTGRDMGSLITEADTVFTKISTDPVLKSVTEQAMEELNALAVRSENGA